VSFLPDLQLVEVFHGHLWISVGPLSDDFGVDPRTEGGPMEIFCKLFDSLLAFVYHCFDRIVIQGYPPLLTLAAAKAR
jgi:hypothetical protein